MCSFLFLFLFFYLNDATAETVSNNKKIKVWTNLIQYVV